MATELEPDCVGEPGGKPHTRRHTAVAIEDDQQRPSKKARLLSSVTIAARAPAIHSSTTSSSFPSRSINHFGLLPVDIIRHCFGFLSIPDICRTSPINKRFVKVGIGALKNATFLVTANSKNSSENSEREDVNDVSQMSFNRNLLETVVKKCSRLEQAFFCQEIDDEAVTRVVNANIRLYGLVVMRLGTFSDTFMTTIPQLSELRCLKLSGCCSHWHSFDNKKLLVILQNCRRLLHLELTGLGGAGSAFKHMSTKLPSLSLIEYVNCDVRDDEIRSMAEVLPNLSVFSIVEFHSVLTAEAVEDFMRKNLPLEVLIILASSVDGKALMKAAMNAKVLPDLSEFCVMVTETSDLITNASKALQKAKPNCAVVLVESFEGGD